MEEIITVVDRIQEIYTEAEVIFQVFLNFDKFFRNVQREPIAKAALHAWPVTYCYSVSIHIIKRNKKTPKHIWIAKIGGFGK